MSRNLTTIGDNPILRFFPTPEFLAMPAVGMSFSDTHVRFVEFVSGGITGGAELGDYAVCELPDGVISSGEVRDRERLAATVREMKEKFSFSFVCAALPEQKGYLYETNVPITEEGILRDSVEFTVPENVPLSLDEAVFDFDIGSVDTQSNTAHVVVTVFPRSVIEQYAGIVEEVGLAPLSFELEAHAVGRAVVSSTDPATYIIVHTDGQQAGLYIVSRNVVHFTSTLSLGTESLGGSGGTFASRAPSTVSQDSDAGLINDGRARGIVRQLTAEISKLTDFWTSRADGNATHDRVSAVIVSGDVAGDDSVVAELNNAHECNVYSADVWTNIFSLDDYVPDISARESYGYAAAVGMALPSSG